MLHNENGLLFKDGQPFRHIGVNGYELFFKYGQGYDTNPPIWKRGLDLIASYNIKVCRTILLGPEVHHWPAYFLDPTAYKTKIQAFLDYAASMDVQIVATLCPNWQALPDRFNERMQDWLNPASATRVQFQNVITDIVTAFKDHPAVGAWEMGNEWNTELDYRQSYNGDLDGLPKVGTYTRASYQHPEDSYTTERYLAALNAFISAVKAIDMSNRLLMTGNNLADPYGYGMNRAAARVLVESPTNINTLDFHGYINPSLTPGRFWAPDSRGMESVLRYWTHRAYQRGQVFVLGEFGVDADSTYTALNQDHRAIFEKMIKAIELSHTPLSMAWTVHDPAVFAADNRVQTTINWCMWPGSNKEFQLALIKEANDRIALDKSRF